MSSPFFHYHSCFDAEKLIRQYAVPDLQPTPGYLTNFLGVKVDPKFVPQDLAGREGQLEGIPIPTSWHADLAEWAAALRAVDIAAGPEFVVVELGCGWGCWMNNAGAAAKKRNLRVKLIGVEGDEGHCRFADESLRENGFDENDFEVRHGVAAAKAGTALFPRQEQAGKSWGLQPIFGATDEQIAEARATNSCDVLPTLSLEDVFAKHLKIDLLHVDIQGGELDLVEQSMPILGKKVAYLLIGTHSREVEGGLFDVLLRHGWQLEIERPAILKIQSGRQPFVTVDGVQGWRNTALLKKTSAPTLTDGMSFSVAANDFAFSNYFVGTGWSDLEPEFVWSEGEEAELSLRFKSAAKKRLYLDLAAFLPTADFAQHIEVTANSIPLGGVTFTRSANRGKHYFDLPPSLGKTVTLKILVGNPISPQEAKTSGDPRRLGVALYGFGLEAAPLKETA